MNLHKAPSPKQESTAAEMFFKNKLSISTLSREEFISRMRLHDPQMSDEEILEAQGYNFDEDGKTVIIIREDAYPKEYIPYIETHEKWEAYIARKSGYNLYKKATRKYKEDGGVEWTKERKESFFSGLKDFNYEFRHEYAIYKEYEHAQKDGRLEEWHTFHRNRENELVQGYEHTEVPAWLINDMSIRQSIYEKLTTGTKHYFIREQ